MSLNGLTWYPFVGISRTREPLYLVRRSSDAMKFLQKQEDAGYPEKPYSGWKSDLFTELIDAKLLDIDEEKKTYKVSVYGMIFVRNVL